MKNICILGAGLSGLATAWFLLHLNDPPTVTLFSQGNEASRISAGLLHKYMGVHAKLNPFAIEGEKKTHELISLAQTFSEKPIVISKGFIRPAQGEKQLSAYQECAKRYSDVDWIENCQTLDPQMISCPGIFIHSGAVIDTSSYLEALKKGCQSKGMRIVQEAPLLSSFDHVIYATGADSQGVHPLKGQLLEVHWPLPPLPYSVVGQVYLAMTADPTRAVIGATYEHSFTTKEPEVDFAIQTLFPKAMSLYPALQNAEILSVKAGLRASTPNRLPIAEVVSPQVSRITGMGSRGLLYHAYFAEQLVNKLKEKR